MVNLFTRGLPLRIIMVGTLTGLQWGEFNWKARAWEGGGAGACRGFLFDRKQLARQCSTRGTLLLARRRGPPTPANTCPPARLAPTGIYDAFKVSAGLPTSGGAKK